MDAAQTGLLMGRAAKLAEGVVCQDGQAKSSPQLERRHVSSHEPDTDPYCILGRLEPLSREHQHGVALVESDHPMTALCQREQQAPRPTCQFQDRPPVTACVVCIPCHFGIPKWAVPLIVPPEPLVPIRAG